MKKILIALLSVVSLGLAANHSNHSKHSNRPCLDPFDAIDWNFFWDTLDLNEGFCKCKKPFPRVGIKIQYAEPIAFIETPYKAWDFICFGNTRSKTSVMRGDGTNLGKTGAKINVHFIRYPIFEISDLVSDITCGTSPSIWSLVPTGLSEVNPLLWDDELSILAQPWKLLIANPIAQSLCLADCAAASAVPSTRKGITKYEALRNSLFYCAGCWGAIIPDTTTTAGQDSLVESALTATKVVDLLHETLQLRVYQEHAAGLGLVAKAIDSRFSVPTKVYCEPKYFPIIVKSQYWLNLAYPTREHAIPIGDFPPKWSWFKKTPGKEQDVWTLWRIRTCCAL